MSSAKGSQGRPDFSLNLSGNPVICSGSPSEHREQVFAHMLRTRRGKYEWWLRGMKAVKYATCECERGELLETVYAVMHYIDDMVDGDAPVSEGYLSAASYVKEKMEFVKVRRQPKDSMEVLLQHALDLAEKMGEDFSSEIQDILESMLFDAQRRNPGFLSTYPQEQLQQHFHMQDIRGTIGACLKIAREPNVAVADLQLLGEASRIYYTLRDLEEDTRAGFCNVSREDIEELQIMDLRDPESPGIQRWLHKEASRGMEMIGEHRQTIPRLPMRRFTKFALKWFYERPAAKYFTGVLFPKS